LDRLQAEQYAPRYLSGCRDEVKGDARSDPERIGPSVQSGPDGCGQESGRNRRRTSAYTHALRENGRHTKLVLGVRDILDEPERTRKVLAGNAVLT